MPLKGADCDFASEIELLDDHAFPDGKLCKAPDAPGALCNAATCQTRACVLAVTDLAPGQEDELSSDRVSSDEAPDVFQC